MKKIFLPLVIPVFIISSCSHSKKQNDPIETFFDEIQIATKQNAKLWNQDINGPLLFVEPDDRIVYSNVQDKAEILKKDGAAFKGLLPKEINIANTSIQWEGVNWAMIMLPLPNDKFERLNLCTHELFHRSQASLGFEASNPENNHLDKKDGRIYLRLELEALKMAISANSPVDMKKHLSNALILRKYRYSIFHKADSTENLLELNEGIAEYTGVMMSGRSEEEMQTHFVKSIGNFSKTPTFVRSFAYQTTPIYGYLLHKTNRIWNQDIKSRTNLTEYFTHQFQISIPIDLYSAIENIILLYNYQAINSDEIDREEKIIKILAEYKSKFVISPHLEIQFEQMSISFNPGNISPLEDYGTVYPTLRVSDKWGILTVSKGALISTNWDKVIVSKPTEINKEKAVGDGWTLDLNKGYEVEKDSKGNYTLAKQ